MKLLTSESDSDLVTRCVHQMELQKTCWQAVTMEQEALTGIPQHERREFPKEAAPYAPQNVGKWEDAARLGIPDGQYLFGQCLISGGQTEAGLQWLKAAVSQDHTQAKRALGDFLLDRGEHERGLALLLEAADSGDAYACERLAERYDEGDGVKRSKRKYRLYLRRAAAMGSDTADLFLRIERLR